MCMENIPKITYPHENKKVRGKEPYKVRYLHKYFLRFLRIFISLKERRGILHGLYHFRTRYQWKWETGLMGN